MRPLNAQKVINEIQEIDWTNVSIETDAQHAYRKFHKIISKKLKCFPLRKNKTIYHDRIPWMTSGVRESIKIKNKLDVSTKRDIIKKKNICFISNIETSSITFYDMRNESTTKIS